MTHILKKMMNKIFSKEPITFNWSLKSKIISAEKTATRKEITIAKHKASLEDFIDVILGVCMYNSVVDFYKSLGMDDADGYKIKMFRAMEGIQDGFDAGFSDDYNKVKIQEYMKIGLFSGKVSVVEDCEEIQKYIKGLIALRGWDIPRFLCAIRKFRKDMSDDDLLNCYNYDLKDDRGRPLVDDRIGLKWILNRYLNYDYHLWYKDDSIAKLGPLLDKYRTIAKLMDSRRKEMSIWESVPKSTMDSKKVSCIECSSTFHIDYNVYTMLKDGKHSTTRGYCSDLCISAQKKFLEFISLFFKTAIADLEVCFYWREIFSRYLHPNDLKSLMDRAEIMSKSILITLQNESKSLNIDMDAILCAYSRSCDDNKDWATEYLSQKYGVNLDD